jgi:hypothetical protein
MPKATTALFGSEVVTVEGALEIRGTEKRAKSQADFSCEECQRPVRAHKASGTAAAHFEHLAHNPLCSRSHDQEI